MDVRQHVKNIWRARDGGHWIVCDYVFYSIRNTRKSKDKGEGNEIWRYVAYKRATAFLSSLV